MKSLLTLILFFILSSAYTKTYSQIPYIDEWEYIQVDDTNPKYGDFGEPEWLRYFGVDMGDVSSDGFLDIITGRHVYINPGGSM